MKRLLGLLLCLTATPALAADTVKIALTGPFSGGSAPMGASTRDGSKLAIAEINAAGGIQVGGKKLKIEIVERDDEAKNERGALIAQELAAMTDLSGVIGSVNTGVGHGRRQAPPGEGHHQDHLPRRRLRLHDPVGRQAGRPGPKDLSIFRFAAHDGIQAAWWWTRPSPAGSPRWPSSTTTPTTASPAGTTCSTRSRSRGTSSPSLTQEKFNIGDKDMTAQLLKAKSLGAQAILIWAIGPEEAAVSNGMAKLGMKVPLIGGWTLSMSNYIDNAGANGNGTLMPQTFIEEPITPRAKTFIESYHKAYGVTPHPLAGGRRPGLRRRADLRRRREAGRLHRHPQDQGGPRGPEGAGGRRHRPLEEALHASGIRPTSPPTRPSAASRPSWAWSRTAAWCSPTRPTRPACRSAAPSSRAHRAGEAAPPASPPALPVLPRRTPCPSPIVAQIAVSGALMGLVYALVAYGFQLTYATSEEHQLRAGRAGDGLGLREPHAHRPGACPTGWWCRSACSSAPCSAWWWSGPRCAWPWSRRARAGSSSPSSSASSSSPPPRTSGGATTAPSRPPSRAPPSTSSGVDVTGLEISVAVGVLRGDGAGRALQAAHPARQGLRGGLGRPRRRRADGHLGHPHRHALLRPLRRRWRPWPASWSRPSPPSARPWPRP